MQNSSKNSVVQYGVYLAKVCFEDKPSVYKIRPILVLDSDKMLVAALKMTSKTNKTNYPLYYLKKWRKYGLIVPTAVRLDKILELRYSEIYTNKLLTILDDDDIVNIISNIKIN